MGRLKTTEQGEKALWYVLLSAILIGGIFLAEYRTLFVGLCYLLMLIYLIAQIRRKKMTVGKAIAFVCVLVVMEMLRRYN